LTSVVTVFSIYF